MADPLLSVCWKDYSNALAAECKTLFDNDFLVDCTISAEGQSLKAHRLILSACSPYFRMLFSGEREKHPILILKDTLFVTLKALMGFVYHGEAQVPQGQLQAFLELAKSLQIKGLRYFRLEDKNKNSDASGKDAPPCPPLVNRHTSEVVHSDASHEDNSKNSSQQQRLHHSEDHSHAVQMSPNVPFESCSDLREQVQSVSTAQEQQASPKSDEVLIETEITVKPEPLFSVFMETKHEVLDDVECDKSMSEVNEETTLPYSEQDMNQYLSGSESSHGNVELASVVHHHHHHQHQQHQQVIRLPTEPSSEPAVEPDPAGPVLLMPKSEQMDEADTEELMMDVHDEPENYTSDGAEPVYGEQSISQSSKIVEEAAKAEESLVPVKSKEVYEKEYEKFKNWMRAKNINIICEAVVLAYISELSAVSKASTLWCTHSKLKTMLKIKDNIDIAGYRKLHSYMKQVNIGYVPEKSMVFCQDDVKKFLIEAPDEKYLMMKVVAMFGIFGACRRVELYNMCTDDVSEEGCVLIVKIREPQTNKARIFTVVSDEGFSYIDLYKRYIGLRPPHVKHNKLFLFYNKGKCTSNPVGINTFGKIPKHIAEYLKLPNPEKFSGHSFRRTSSKTNKLTDHGVCYQITTLKHQAGWQSSNVVESYIEESIRNKFNPPLGAQTTSIVQAHVEACLPAVKRPRHD